ncbi:MAG: PIN domain-containing protein, partial [Gammaproteobacteria bacterium]
FLAIVTHPRIFKDPTPLAVAFDAIDSWQAYENLQLLSESEGYLDKLREQSRAAQVRGPLVHDARIAALCLHHGVSELWSADGDFSRFPQLPVRNPLS